VRELFGSMGLDPDSMIRRYPHQLSGGQCQRVALAAAMAGQPGLLLADEPTSSLDVVVQAQIVELLRSLRENSGVAMLFVTHDLGLAGSLADRVAVVHQGSIVESGSSAEILRAPNHPYTKSLVAARR
jgi:ABC-type glutathione transport system ATPase component